MKGAHIALAVISIGAFALSATSASGADRTIGLGTAGNFVLLAGTTVANTGATLVSGNVGVSPGSAITGFPPGLISGATDADNSTATQAQSDLAAAYAASEEATELPCETTISGNLAGLTLTPGVYCMGAAAAITGTLTLNFQGDANAFFLFRINGALTTAAASAVHVINTGTSRETCAPNTFWALNGAAGFGAATHFTGTILANGAVTSGAGTTTTGRLLATAAVTMDSNTVSACPNPIPPSAALSVTATGSPDPAAPGSYILYPITATNAGPDSASEASMTAILPIGLDFGAISAPAGWSCTTPLPGAPGTVTCTAEAFATGSANFALTAQAYPGISSDRTVSLPVSVSSLTGDPDQSDLSTSVATQVVVPIVTLAATPVTTLLQTPVTAPVAPTTAEVISPCISDRHFTLRLTKTQASDGGTRITKAILLNAKRHRIKTLKITSTSVDVDLRGLSAQKVTMRVSTKTRSGKTTSSFTRSYETCS